MKKLFLLLLVLTMVFAFAACSAKTATTQTEQPAQTEKAAGTGGTTASTQKADTVQVKEVVAAAPTFTNILFDYNSYTIRTAAQPNLKTVADWLIKNKTKITLEGYCDERGTNEYNLALGEKRAKAAKDYLKSLGVAGDTLNTISYGEEKPLCTEKNENCWQRNRRVQFVVNK
jgi:peptidoglycan-associated lipoprotein